MLNILGQGLSWLSQILTQFLNTILDFFLGGLPNAINVTVVQRWINTFLDIYTQSDLITWFYWPNLAVLLNASLIVFGVGICIRVTKLVLSVVHKIMDSIPILG